MTRRRFEGRTALVTGGGTGIGAAVARRLAQDGANVVLLGRRREPLDRVAAETGAVVECCDAAESTAVRAAVARLRDRFGSLDILVANAGGAGFGPTERMGDEDWTQALRANLDTAFVSARESLPALMAARGAIAIVSSIAGLAAMPDAAGYVTAKHACIGLGRSLARDFGRRGEDGREDRRPASCRSSARNRGRSVSMSEIDSGHRRDVGAKTVVPEGGMGPILAGAQEETVTGLRTPNEKGLPRWADRLGRSRAEGLREAGRQGPVM